MSPSTENSERREFATEMKFVVSPAQASAIREWISPRLSLDPHADSGGGYRVTSLYFDTPARDVFRRKGSYGRSKYRVRRYGELDFVFLERKMKRKDRVGKTRSTVGLDEISELDGFQASRGWDGYWFHRRLLARNLEPVCQISYRRSAWAMMTELGAIRVTIDADIRAVPVERHAFREAQGDEVTDRRILEIKFRRHMPSMFRELVRRFALVPQAMSKYRLAAAELGLAELGLAELGLAEVSMAELGLAERGSAERGPAKLDLAEELTLCKAS